MIKIANAPCSWGVLEFEAKTESPGYEQVLDETVRCAIDTLAARYRTVVVMHDIEGYTHHEIGAALGITVATSKVRLSRARKKLRSALADDSGGLAYEQ